MKFWSLVCNGTSTSLIKGWRDEIQDKKKGMDKGHNFKTLKNGNDFDFKITFGQEKEWTWKERD